MNRYSLAAIGAATVLVSSPACSQTVKCTHARGERLFYESDTVLIERRGVAVTIRLPPSVASAAREYWNYRVVFEEQGIGFRAIRSSKPEGGTDGLDVVYGGELYFLVEKGVSRALVTNVEATTGKVATEGFKC